MEHDREKWTELYKAAKDLINLGGRHKGPCTNQFNPHEEACELHLKTHAARWKRLRNAIKVVEKLNSRYKSVNPSDKSNT